MTTPGGPVPKSSPEAFRTRATTYWPYCPQGQDPRFLGQPALDSVEVCLALRARFVLMIPRL